jgi:hypothetical protein
MTLQLPHYGIDEDRYGKLVADHEADAKDGENVEIMHTVTPSN